MESLSVNLKGVKRMRFWMTFGDAYLKHLEVFRNIGLDSIEPIMFEGREIVPIQFLKALLPDPASLGPRTKGKTNIGVIVKGTKDGKPLSRYVYNICDHQECYKETNAQGVSYTTGVPAMIGAMMMITGSWMRPGVWNMEEFDPDPFMAALNTCGLPWQDVATDIDIDSLPE
jgi:saccharopine dehydrogenase (NAD+, L-lysine-forming)